MKKKTCIRIGSLTMSAMMLFTACSNTNVMDKNEVSFSYSDSDLNNFVTFDKMNDFNWYVIETLDELTHTMFIVELDDAVILNEHDSMTYDYYFKNVKPKPEKKKKGWVCKICGWVYEGDELPEDLICPICKHPASDFEPL